MLIICFNGKAESCKENVKATGITFRSVGARLPAIAVCQSPDLWLIHLIREQARSHRYLASAYNCGWRADTCGSELALGRIRTKRPEHPAHLL
jgi:hypothetical protein